MNHVRRLEQFYENEGEEELRLQEKSVHYLEYLTMTKYLDQYLTPESVILDNCAGTGAYAFYLANRGCRVTAGDIVSYNVEMIQEKQQKNPVLSEIYCGDALDLSRFADNGFDAVLCMGALYHLHEPAERRRVLQESLRVLKTGGLLFFTYMNRYSVILNNSRGSLSDIDEILLFAKEGIEGVFYASSPEEMEELAASCGAEKLRHIALDGMGYFMRETAALLNDEGMLKWRKYHFAVCEVPSLLGSSYHNLFIAKKRKK